MKLKTLLEINEWAQEQERLATLEVTEFKEELKDDAELLRTLRWRGQKTIVNLTRIEMAKRIKAASTSYKTTRAGKATPETLLKWAVDNVHLIPGDQSTSHAHDVEEVTRAAFCSDLAKFILQEY